MTTTATARRPQWRAVWVMPDITIGDDGRPRPTPAGALDSFGALLDRVAGTFERAGVMLVDDAGAKALGLPVTRDQLGADDAGASALADAARHGWKTGRLGDWTIVYDRERKRPEIRLGIVPLMTRDQCPLLSDSPADTVAAFGLWHRLTGSPYHTAPGVAGLDVLEALVPGGDTRPAMRIGVHPDDAYEDDYRVCERGRCERGCLFHFRGPASGLEYAHGYDLNRAYVGAAVTVDLASKPLAPTGRRRFDKGYAGWWLCELPTWQANRAMPDPAGYGYIDAGGRPKSIRWLQTPTVALLEDLTELGAYAGVRIVDSFTAPARRPLRPWGERMRNAYELYVPGPNKAERGVQLAGDQLGAERVELVRDALKESGRRTLGMLASRKSDTTRAYRPDWWYAVVALTRCNLWRAMDKIGADMLGYGRKQGINPEGRYPALIDVDNVYYPSDDRNPVTARPVALPFDPSGVRLGHFKPSRSVRRRSPAAGVS